jgi:hypothetical protein
MYSLVLIKVWQKISAKKKDIHAATVQGSNWNFHITLCYIDFSKMTKILKNSTAQTPNQMCREKIER